MLFKMDCERKANLFLRLILRCLNFVFLGCVLLSFTAILVIIIEALFRDGWHFWPVTQGVKNAIMFWYPYVPIIKLLGYSATLLLASYNLSKYMDVMTIEALRTIRERFNEKKKNALHEFILHKDDREPIIVVPDNKQNGVRGDADKDEFNDVDKLQIKNTTIYDYLGTIELGAIMLRKGMISIDEFYNQFGYRIENIFRNSDICQHVNNNYKYYKWLIYARDVLQKEGLLDLSE